MQVNLRCELKSFLRITYLVWFSLVGNGMVMGTSNLFPTFKRGEVVGKWFSPDYGILVAAMVTWVMIILWEKRIFCLSALGSHYCTCTVIWFRVSFSIEPDHLQELLKTKNITVLKVGSICVLGYVPWDVCWWTFVRMVSSEYCNDGMIFLNASTCMAALSKSFFNSIAQICNLIKLDSHQERLYKGSQT